MPRLETQFHRLLRAALVAAAACALTGAAKAEDGMHPLDSALEMLNLKTKPGQMPDFVKQTRGSQAEDGYIPIGEKPPARGIKPKSAADVKALTAELDAARDAQLAGKRPKPMGQAASRKAGKPAKRHPHAAQATNH